MCVCAHLSIASAKITRDSSEMRRDVVYQSQVRTRVFCGWCEVVVVLVRRRKTAVQNKKFTSTCSLLLLLGYTTGLASNHIAFLLNDAKLLGTWSTESQESKESVLILTAKRSKTNEKAARSVQMLLVKGLHYRRAHHTKATRRYYDGSFIEPPTENYRRRANGITGGHAGSRSYIFLDPSHFVVSSLQQQR